MAAPKGNINASKFDMQIVEEVCLMVEDGLNIKKALKSNKKYPSFNTWCRWKRENPVVRDLYYSIPKMKKFKDRAIKNEKYQTDGKFDKNKYYRIKRKENPSERLRYSISSSIYQKIKSNKNGSIIKSLPYTIDVLKTHLESLFEKGMTWDNYGDWHIDHIKPHSLFNYRTMNCKEFKKCWALDNLQPLWAIDNIKKSNNYE